MLKPAGVFWCIQGRRPGGTDAWAEEACVKSEAWRPAGVGTAREREKRALRRRVEDRCISEDGRSNKVLCEVPRKTTKRENRPMTASSGNLNKLLGHGSRTVI